MTLDLSNPAVSFLFFTGFGLWTLFVAWASCDYMKDRFGVVTIYIGVASVLVGLIALGNVIFNALITP